MQFLRLGANLRTLVIGLIGFRHNLQELSNGSSSDSEDEDEYPNRRASGLNFTEAEKLCEEYMRKNDVPGMAICVHVSNRIVHTQAFGMKDSEKKIEATADMQGNIASLSKLLCAQCAIRMYLNSLEGSGNEVNWWTANVYDYLPDMPKYRDPFTQQETTELPLSWLFCNLAGFRGRILSNEAFNETHYDNATEATELYFDDYLFVNKPGEIWEYSSLGCNIAGAFIEAVTGRNYADFARDELRRMKLNCMDFHTPEHEQSPNWAKGYAIDDGEGNPCGQLGQGPNMPLEQTIDYSCKYPSEGLVSDVKDLCTFGDKYVDMIEKTHRQESTSLTLFGDRTPDVIRRMFGIHGNLKTAVQRGVPIKSYQGYVWCVVQHNYMRSRGSGYYRNQFWFNGNAVGHSSVLSIVTRSRYDPSAEDFQNVRPPVPQANQTYAIRNGSDASIFGSTKRKWDEVDDDSDEDEDDSDDEEDDSDDEEDDSGDDDTDDDDTDTEEVRDFRAPSITIAILVNRSQLGHSLRGLADEVSRTIEGQAN